MSDTSFAPEFSIIIPCYNGEMFIDHAIESVLSQPYTNWELIIVNDGSIDNTESICKSFEQDSRIRVITVKNGGTGKARNIGIDNAKGKWIVFLDADDLFLNDSLSQDLVSRLDEYYRNNADVVFTSSAKSDFELTRIFKCYPAENDYQVIPAKEFWTGIYRKDFIIDNNIRFFEYREQDVESAFKVRVISSANSIVNDDSIWFYLQRVNEESNTHTWNLSTLHYIKVLVYKQLIDENNTKQFAQWLSRIVFDEANKFYHVYNDESLNDVERKRKVNDIYRHIVHHYGRDIRNEIGNKKYIKSIITYLKANIGIRKKRNIIEGTQGEKSNNIERLNGLLVQQRLRSISKQIERNYK